MVYSPGYLRNGPVFRWFAWHPTDTEDRGWRWLRFVWRRRVESRSGYDNNHAYHYYTGTHFATRVEKWTS